MKRLVAALVLALAGLVATMAQAHEVRPAYLSIDQRAPEDFDVLWKVPTRGEARLALGVSLPSACAETSPVVAADVGAAMASRWSVRCTGGLDGKTLAIDGLVATYTDVIARIAWSDGTVQTARLTPDFPDLVLETAPGALATAKAYFFLGVEHILLGIDHLLFVLALLLLIRDLRRLIETITAFTVAHSITLAAAALGWTQVPQPPVEAAIALSIAVVAAEIIRAERGETDLSIRYPWLIAFLFGLLHGFGFGGALRDIGLPQKDVPLALLTFNLGVEAGQLLFVAAVLVVALVARRLFAMRGALIRGPVGYATGCVAGFWFVERVVSFMV
ncbi:HupE/UreJ family protein [Microbaculum sp. FT89]|uniref:HupE/UreJ family protein n=1 Tax=Microbaculum sp. FT89 TaxID=3447298 RepID=UPI003F537F82